MCPGNSIVSLERDLHTETAREIESDREDQMKDWIARGLSLVALFGLVVVLIACGAEAIGPDEFHRVAGSYVGPIEGTTSIGPFSGTVWVELSQSESTLTGTYHFNGDIRYAGEDLWYFQSGSGTVQGSMESGPTPQLSLTLTPSDCPSRVMTYQGEYADGPAQISITGSLLLSTELCDPLVPIQHETILQRY